jgi:Ca-activated chloride channel family protein
MIHFLRAFAPGLRHIGALAAAFALVANITILLCSDGTAGAARLQGQVLRVQVDLQSIPVRVTDKQGHDVRGLSADDFTITEDHRPQKIAFFGEEKVPTSLSVLVDSGGSMSLSSKVGSAEAVAAKFMRSGREGDEISAMDFTDQFGPYRQLTREQLLNPSSLLLAPGPGEGSAVYDAIAMAVCHLRASKNLRKAIVVITDGDDQQSRITLDQLVELLQSSPAQVFMVGWHSKPEFHMSGSADKKMTLVSGRDIDNPPYVFDRLVKEAGAESVFPTSEDGMGVALKKVSDLLDAQYTIAYYPENTTKKFRRIEVKTKRPGLMVTVRRGVGSNSAAASPVNFVGESCGVSPELHPYPYESRVSHDDKGIITYHETFSDTHTGWPNHEGSRYAEGGYELSSVASTKVEQVPGRNARQPGTFFVTDTGQRDVLAAYGPWWGDFRVSAIVDPVIDLNRVKPAPPNARSSEIDRPSAGLVFRLGVDGYYAALLSGVQGQKEWWLKIVKRQYGDSPETEIAPWSLIDVPKKGRGGLKLAVETVGTEITVFVDDQEVKRAQDTSLGEGYVGFVISGAERAVFRDLVVEEVQ